MSAPHGPDPALTVAMALALGMVAQTLARHLRVPGIVLLLAAGVLFGPDGMGIVQPEVLGDGLSLLVSFAVSIILFEGGLSLNLRRLRKEATSIRRLVTLGAVVTTVGAAAAAHYILGWDWRLSLLFGTLVIVTGPTVIQPLLRRIRVKRKIATILEAEGVFGDAVGALVAVIALEVALAPSGQSLARGVADFAVRFSVGGALGLALGLLLVLLLRYDRVLPAGLANVFTLAMVVFVFQFSHSLFHESGIVAAVIAGVTVANVRGEVLHDLREFKEQLTVLFIGMLFVLLAADVRIEEVQALGVPGIVTVLVLMLVVRPLNIAASTWGTALELRDRLFLSWLAPRGIVAAAVSSLFAISLEEAGIPGGKELRALVFLVIASTVLIQGLSGGVVAALLKVRPPAPSGYLILGADPLNRQMAAACREAGVQVMLVDSNPDHCKEAESAGHRVIYGNGLDENVLRRAHLESWRGCLGLTQNEGINFSFVRRNLKEYGVSEAWVALPRGSSAITSEMVEREGAKVLFGARRALDFWSMKSQRGEAKLEQWMNLEADAEAIAPLLASPAGQKAYLPLALGRGSSFRPLDKTVTAPKGVEFLWILAQTGAQEQVKEELGALGWRRVEDA